MNINFWFEFASTYSYPTAMRIEKIAKERNVQVSWRPFLLGPIFQKQNWNDSPFNLYPAKGRYMWRDLERLCVTYSLPFQHPSVFPRNGVLAARVACRFANEAWLPDFVRSVYKANFELDLDISDPEIIKRCLVSSGEDPDAIVFEAQTQKSKQRLRSQTEEAEQLYIFGSPSFIVGQELFWGNDRLEDALSFALEHST